MIKTIYKKELLDHIHKFRFTFITIIVIVLIAECTVLNVENYRQKLENYNTAFRGHKEELNNFRVYPELTPKIEYKSEVLGILSKGIAGQFATTVEVHRTKMPEFKANSTVDNEYLVAFSEIDISHIIVIIFSLLGLLLGFDAINGERRSGTLKLSLANQVPRYKLLLAKCLGGITILSLSLMTGFFFCLIIIINSQSIALNIGEWLRIGGFLVSSILYATTFYLLGILLSISVREPATSLALAMFFWVILVIVWPGMAQYLGMQIMPVPSIEYLLENDGFEYYKPNDLLKLYGDFGKAGKYEGFSLGSDGSIIFIGSSDVDQSVLDYLYRRVDTVDNVIREQANREWQIRSLHNTYLMKQRNLIHNISCISPAYLFDYTTSIFCRTDVGSYNIFINRIQEYRRQFLKWFVDIDAMHSAKWFLQKGNLDLSGFPEFSLIRESFIDSLQRATIPLTVLIFINMILFLFSHIIFFRSNI